MDPNRMHFFIGAKSDGLIYSLPTRRAAQDLVQAIHKASRRNEATAHAVEAQDQDGKDVLVFIPSTAVVTIFGTSELLYGKTISD